ncbi:uncharacterized protein [Parasteatoda tepidariorum]|nr:uncharacterized protein LOC107457418 [Parasteatoda tepidariorum]
MSSIPQQESMKPSSKSPIPRSRSDFSYVGLTPKEKRWTTDFSLLLPPFSRDSSGYSRLTESPVTLQPKPRNNSATKLVKSPTMDSTALRSKKNTESRTINRSPTFDLPLTKCTTKDINAASDTKYQNRTSSQLPKSSPVSSSKSLNRIKYPGASYCNLEPGRCLRHEMLMRRSPTMDYKVLNPNRITASISRSPTLDPTVLSRSPRDTCRYANGHLPGRSPLSNRVTLSPSEVVRSQSMRSLRKAGDKSPSRIRNSESAQGDVTSLRKPYPLAEADEFDEEDIRRLRNFTVTSKGLINWGDSFRSHSLTSVPALDFTPSCSNSQWDVASTKSYPMTSSSSHWNCNRKPQRYKVALMGGDEVGKTSLIRQFQTSEYICAFDTSYDTTKDYAITVILNKEESELEFVELRSPDDESDEKDINVKETATHVRNSLNIPYADAHVIVYSVTNRRSFLRALDLTSKVLRTFKRSAVLLVGNKSDLVRVRAVTTDDGQSAAKERGCSFIETSAAINHQVDELLASILTQIRAKNKTSSDCSAASRWSHSPYSLSRAKGLIKKFLKKACFQSKSSDNLQRL